MNKLFLDQGGYIELLRCIRRLYEKTNKEVADTNTTYTLSLEGNNLKLTPSDGGPAQVLDLSTVIVKKAEASDSATTATRATNADTATHATSADSATTAETATRADSATTAETATRAASATSADSAATATKADSATRAENATSAETASSLVGGDQNTTYSFSLSGNKLVVTPSSGEPSEIDLSTIIPQQQASNTYTLSLDGTLVKLTDQNQSESTVDLGDIISQKVNELLPEDKNTTYTLSLEGNNLKLTPSSGEAQTIDLSSLVRSDDANTTYTLSLEGNNLRLTPSEGSEQSVDLSSIVPQQAEDSDTTYSFTLSGNNLTITPSKGQATTIDLSVLEVAKAKNSDNSTHAGSSDTSTKTNSLSEQVVLPSYTAEYDSSSKAILLKKDGSTVSTIDASSFVKDGMVESVSLAEKTLTVTFNTEAGKTPINIDLSTILTAYEAGTGVVINNNSISVNKEYIDGLIDAKAPAIPNYTLELSDKSVVLKNGDSIVSTVDLSTLLTGGGGGTTYTAGSHITISETNEIDTKDLNKLVPQSLSVVEKDSSTATNNLIFTYQEDGTEKTIETVLPTFNIGLGLTYDYVNKTLALDMTYIKTWLTDNA